VRYSVGGRSYEAHHDLTGPIRTHRPGDKLPILLLLDDPGHSFVAGVPGYWLRALLPPVGLLLGAAVMAGMGSLFRRAA
jgi:hypothetical protein